MNEMAKAAGVTILTLAPLAIRELATPEWTWPLIVAYASAVFIGNWKFVFRPDERFASVMVPNLDNFFETAFSEVKSSERQRFPLRVNVYRPQWWWPLTRLVVVYEWNCYPTDADYGKTWWHWRGLCGAVYRTGKSGWYKKGEQNSDSYQLSPSDEATTSHVQAVLCIPLRRHIKGADSRVSPKVTSVLAIDALTEDAASILKGWHEAFAVHQDHVLQEKAARLGLHF